MNNRERLRALAAGAPVDRKPFFFYFGPWPEAVARWREEGLARDWKAEYGVDEGIEILNVNCGYLPAFEEVVIEERAHTRVIRDRLGITQEVRRTGASIPHYLDYPVKCRADWEALKARLDPDEPARVPQNLVSERPDAALQLGAYPYGLFGTLRDMVGVETLLFWMYDEQDLVWEMMDYLTTFWLAIYARAVRAAKVDVIHIWEDMSGRNGSLISPAMVKRFMLPNYRRIRDFADRNDIPFVAVDTDGDCSELIPLFLDAGINMMMPFEVQAGMDVTKIAKAYPDLTIMGGFDKRVLWTSRAAIDAEFERLLPMRAPGVRWILAPDHLIPPEVPLEQFDYFMRKTRLFLNVKG